MIIGVDAGGSNTRVLIASSTGDHVLRHQGSAAGLRPGQEQEAAWAIATLVREGLSRADADRARALVVGAAGAGHSETRRTLVSALEVFGLADKVNVTTDMDIALQSVFPNDTGILAAAGTGSFACARMPDGSLQRVGGLGWKIGDEGSGYRLAISALQLVGRTLDGRASAPALTSAVMNTLECTDLREFLNWTSRADQAQTASLARLVCELAAENDPDASLLVEDAAWELLSLVRSLTERMGCEDAVPVAVWGGLLEKGSHFRMAFESVLESELEGAEFTNRQVDPTKGAIELAGQLATT